MHTPRSYFTFSWLRIYLFGLLVLQGMTSNSLYSQQNSACVTDPEVSAMTILCECDKYVWARSNSGLCWINKSSLKLKLLTMKNSILPSNIITCGVSFPTGQTYIGTENGILFWDNYAFILINKDNSKLPDNHIVSMTFDNTDNLCIITHHGGKVIAIGKWIKPFKMDLDNDTKEQKRNIQQRIENKS